MTRKIIDGSGLSEIITYQYYFSEMKPIITYGDLGIGKSSHNIQTTAIAYGSYEYPNWEKMKERLVHKPIEFFEDCLINLAEGNKEINLVWEDAGVWLFAMEYNKPFAIAVMKYLQLSRTRYGGILFNAPEPDVVLKKVRTFPSAITVKIIKAKDDLTHPKRPRLAIVYSTWKTPDGKKWGVREEFAEKFNAILPDDIYKWYMPIRESYEQQAVIEMWMILKPLLNNGDPEVVKRIDTTLTKLFKDMKVTDQVKQLLDLEPSYNINSKEIEMEMLTL